MLKIPTSRFHVILLFDSVAAEIKNRLKKIQDNVTKFESGPADESINVS